MSTGIVWIETINISTPCRLIKTYVQTHEQITQTKIHIVFLNLHATHPLAESLRTLKIMPSNLNEIMYVYEYGFCYIVSCFKFGVKETWSSQAARHTSCLGPTLLYFPIPMMMLK
jgi:hypothetical protein